MSETRICNLCPENGPQDISNFGKYLARSGNIIHRRRCNKCRRKESAKRYEENPNVKEKMKRTAKTHHLRTHYGITLEDYEKIYVEQNGKCKICNKHKSILNIDHCHVSGEVRGLLCWSCNIALGYFKDSLSNLKNAIKYLGG